VIPPPIVAPFLPTPAHNRFVKRGFFMCCTQCGLTIDYCRCGERSADAQGAQDGAESSLAKRVAEARGRR